MKIQHAKTRGRPPNSANPKTTNSDLIIAKSIHQLMMWGFPLRSRGRKESVAECASNVAKIILNRTDSTGLALSSDRIEQIFEIWVRKEKQRRSAAKSWPLHQRWRYTKESLQEKCPNRAMSLCQLCEILVRNNGNWPYPENPYVKPGDLILSNEAFKMLGGWMPKFAK